MKSLNRRYIPELDQLRAYASVVVLFYHSYHAGRVALGRTDWPRANVVNALLIEGHMGVALFIVLSGFVLANGTLGKEISYRSFLTNRILRIFPLMTFVMVYAIYGSTNVSFAGMASAFLFLFNTQPHFFDDPTKLTGTFWTISVEFQFYLVACFVFSFTGRNGLKYILSLILLCFIFKCLCLFPYRNDSDEIYYITYYTIVGRIDQFLCGVTLAYLWPSIAERFSGRRSTSAIALASSVAAAVALAMVYNLGGGDTVWHGWMIVRQEVEALIWAAVIGSYILARPWDAWPRVSRLLNGIGVISFSIYILHVSIEQDFWALVAEQGFRPARAPLAFVAGCSTMIFVVTLALSILSYNLIEKPFLGLRKRYVEPGGDAPRAG